MDGRLHAQHFLLYPSARCLSSQLSHGSIKQYCAACLNLRLKCLPRPKPAVQAGQLAEQRAAAAPWCVAASNILCFWPLSCPQIWRPSARAPCTCESGAVHERRRLPCAPSADAQKQGSRYWRYSINELGICDISAGEGGWSRTDLTHRANWERARVMAGWPGTEQPSGAPAPTLHLPWVS